MNTGQSKTEQFLSWLSLVLLLGCRLLVLRLFISAVLWAVVLTSSSWPVYKRLVAIYFARFVLKLNPVILLGALCGGQTVAAALSAVNEETESMTPVLGFTVTYAISNVLLAVWGPVIVALA